MPSLTKIICAVLLSIVGTGIIYYIIIKICRKKASQKRHSQDHVSFVNSSITTPSAPPIQDDFLIINQPSVPVQRDVPPPHYDTVSSYQNMCVIQPPDYKSLFPERGAHIQ